MFAVAVRPVLQLLSPVMQHSTCSNVGGYRAGMDPFDELEAMILQPHAGDGTRFRRLAMRATRSKPDSEAVAAATDSLVSSFVVLAWAVDAAKDDSERPAALAKLSLLRNLCDQPKN